MNALLRRPLTRLVIAILLIALPFILVSVTDLLGEMRGVISSLAGVLLGIAFERPFRPYNVTFKRWMGRQHWVEIAIISGMVLGIVVSVADALGAGNDLTPLMEQIWIPLYRSAMFAAGITMLRRLWWEQDKTDRSRTKARNVPVPPVKPALPRLDPPVDRRSEHRY